MNSPSQNYKIAADMGMSAAEAAEMYGVTRQAVFECAKRHGIVFADGKKRPDSKELIKMFNDGMTFAEIARVKGENYGTIQSYFKNIGIKARKKPKKYLGQYPDPKDKRRITPQEVRDRFAYCKDTGVVRDRKTGFKPAGYVDSTGYISIWFKKLNIKAHRIAWVLHHGGWPDYVIDHINGIKTDNRISNLQDVSQSENAKLAHARKDATRSSVVAE